MNTLKAKTEERVELIDRMEELSKAAETRTLSKSEKHEFDGIESNIKKLDNEIEGLKKDENTAKQKAFSKMSDSGVQHDEFDSNSFNFEIKKSVPVNKTKPIQDFVLRNYDIHEDEQKADVFSVMAALATGKPKDQLTKRAMNRVTKGATSSAMLTEFLSAQLLDGGLSHSHLAKSGMNVFTMHEPTVRWVKVTTYPTFEWKAENASTTDRTVVFGDETFSAKTLRGFVTVSGEQLQDAHNINKSLRQVFNRSMGNSIDTAGLYGSGVGAEPQGIVNYTDVNTYDNNGLLTSYDPFIYAMALIANDNGMPEESINTSIMTPNAWRDLHLLKESTTDAPLARPEILKNHRFLHTTKVATNEEVSGNRSSIVMGGFSSLNLGVRLSTDIVITPVLSDTYQYNFFVVFRGDFKPTREQDFAVITDVYAPDTIT